MISPRLRPLVLWLGRGLILVIVVLSLVKAPSLPVDIQGGDKIGHFLAYASLAGWYGLLYQGPALWWRGLAFVLLGGALEVAQGLTPHRRMEAADFLANSLGVVTGILVAAALRRLWPLADDPGRDSR